MKFFAITIMFFLLVMMYSLFSEASVSVIFPAKTGANFDETAKEGETLGEQDEVALEGRFCGLDFVICEDEKKGTFSTYNAEEGQCDRDFLTMASGKQVYEGAVANNCLPFGTRIEVDGLGILTVEDRMNSRYGCDDFDVFRWDRKDNFKRELHYKFN